MKITRDEIKKAKFDDIFFIDDEQGLAILEDIEEIPGTRDPKEGVLSAQGDFIYELKFYVNSLLALTNGINSIIVNVYAERPVGKKTNRRTRNSNPKDIRQMINARKRPNSAAKSRSDNPADISEASETDSLSFAPTQAKNIVGYAKISLRRALSKEDLKNYSNYRATEQKNRRENLSKRGRYEFVSKVNADLSAVSTKAEGRIAIDTTTARSLTVASVSGVVSKSSTKKETTGKKTSASTIKLSMDAIFKNGLDPSISAMSKFPVNTLKDQRSGNSSSDSSRGSSKMNRSTRKKNASGERTRKNVGQRKSIKEQSVTSFAAMPSLSNARLMTPAISNLSLVNIAIPQKSPDQTKKEAPALISFESRAIEFERDIDVQIPRAASKDQLYFEVQLISKDDNAPVQSKIYTVGHKEMLSEFLTPETAPSIGRGTQMRGRNYLTLQQNDPVATQIIIEKKTLNPNSEDMNIPYEEIATVNVTQDMGMEIFEDTSADNIAPNVIMYRAIASSPLGDEGEEYGSVVLPGLQPIAGIASSASTNRNKCSIHAMNNSDRINIEISDIPPGVSAIRLVREDLTSDSYTANSDRPRYAVPNISTGETMTLLAGSISKILYEDTNVEPFRQYRYQCIFRMERGPEELANGEEVIQHIRPRSNILVTPEIGSLKIREEQGETSGATKNTKRAAQTHISFVTSAPPSDSGIEAVSQILAGAGVEQAFIDEVKNDRQRVSDIAAFIIERLDMKTGRRESFGLHRPGSFSDNEKSRSKRRVSTPKAGRTYKYVAKLCLRPPESLFKEALTKVDVQNPSVLDTATDTIETLSQRFLSSFGMFPSLPSDTELKDSQSSSIRSQFQKGLTGIELEIEVKMPSFRPTIEKVKSYRTKRGYNTVTWRCTGDLSRIDHFIIFARYRGVSAPIGKLSGRGNGLYKFPDRKLSGEVGDINYFVKIVYTDYTRSEASSETTRTRERDMSKSLWSKLMKVNARSGSGKNKRNISESDRRKDKS